MHERPFTHTGLSVKLKHEDYSNKWKLTKFSLILIDTLLITVLNTSVLDFRYKSFILFYF